MKRNGSARRCQQPDPGEVSGQEIIFTPTCKFEVISSVTRIGRCERLTNRSAISVVQPSRLNDKQINSRPMHRERIAWERKCANRVAGAQQWVAAVLIIRETISTSLSLRWKWASESVSARNWGISFISAPRIGSRAKSSGWCLR